MTGGAEVYLILSTDFALEIVWNLKTDPTSDGPAHAHGWLDLLSVKAGSLGTSVKKEDGSASGE